MLTLNKLDLNGALIERVPLRNTLLEILHPDVAVAIVHVDPNAVQQDRPTVEAALSRDLRSLRLDFASGGKKHGDFFFTDARPRLAERYWATPEEAMAYGGLLVTECDYPPQIINVPILVVEQGRLGTGDCAGFIHPDLLARLGLPDNVAVQGRVAPAPVTTAPPSSEIRRLFISGSRRIDRAGLEYARTLIRHARSQGWEIIVGDNPQGVDAEVIKAALEEGYDDHLVIYGAYRRCRIKDTGRAKVRLTDGNYTQRDRFMAGQCDAAVGVWNGNSPGTQKAITSAAEMGKHAFLMARCIEGWKNRLPDALEGRWIAKFTAVAPQLDSPLETHAATFDRFALVLPDSSFKGGHKPELVDGQAIIEAPLALGIVRATTKPRQAHKGWQAVQWFPWEAIERDVWPHTQAAIERLNAIASDSAEAARFLRAEQLDEDDPLSDLQQDRGALVPLLQADRANRMIHDPYVVDRLGRILQSTWRRLATSGGVKVPSFMGQPADVLPPNTVVCPELPSGPVIVFRYPIRTWADVQLWRNVGSETAACRILGEGGQAMVRWAQHYRGCAWMSHETAARLGGDFDGDFYQVAPAARFPTIAACIRRFSHRREYRVPDIPKVKTRNASRWADLPRVALDQVDNAVGLIAWAIAKVWAIGRDPGRLETVKCLADELQIAVDKFKYSLVQDDAYIAAVCDAIKKAEEQRGRVTWLDCRKDRYVFRRETPQAEASDALSRLWNRVRDAWEGWTLEAWPLEHQRHLLPQTYSDAQYQQARRVVRWYNRRIAQAMRLPDQARSEAIQRTIALLEEQAAQKPDKAAWASALWHAAIDQARPTSTASIRFHGFLDEVCQALASVQVQDWPETIRVVGLQHNDWATHLEDLEAGAWAVTLAEGPLGDQWRVWAVVEGARLGVIPQDAAIVGRTPLAIPATFTISPTATYADMHVVTA